MAAELLRFLDFELDRGAYQLRHKGRNVRLERIPLDLLFLLAERRGHLVTREEILERIWAKGVFVDTDHAINTAVRKIRRALHDDSERPRFVVTVPTKGYRFVAPLRETTPEPAPVRPQQGAFVGRDREVAELRGAMDDAAGGRARLVLISGAPGVGKTRLTEELTALALSRGMEVIAGHCIEQDESVSYLPFVEILETWIDRCPDTDRMRALLGDQGPELSRMLPKLRGILPDLASPMDLQGEQARRHLFNSLRDFIARLAKGWPLVLIAEDLHWADDSTLSMFTHLANRIANLPLMIVATYRDIESQVTDGFAKMLENLLRGRLATEIGLKGLTRDSVATMIKELSGQEPPADLVSEFHRETEGNPFFVEELFRYLTEEGRLYGSDGRFRSELKIGELEVPRGVRLVIGRRLRRLDDSTQMMLGAAAVIGRSFDFEVLAASSDTERDFLLQSIQEAERAGLILEGDDDGRFEFSHELVRQALITAMAAPRRQQLHLQVADATEQVYADRLEEHVGELAYHYSSAANAPKAVAYLIRAGQQAAQRYAHREAIASLNRAMELLQNLPDDDHRAREELKIQKELVQALWIVRGQSSPEAQSATNRTLELSERLGDKWELYVALNTLMSTHLDRDAAKAREFAERELNVAEQLGIPKAIAFAHAAAMGHVMVLQGEFENAREHLETGLRMLGADPPPGKEVMSWESWARSPGLSLLAWDLWFLGYPDQALRYLARSLAATQSEPHPFWRASGWFYALRVYLCLHHPQTLEVANSLAAYSKERGLSNMTGIAPLFVLWGQADRDGAVEAARQIDVDKAESYRGEPIVSWVSLMMAEIWAKAGKPADGLTMVARGLRFDREFGFASHTAELHRLKGELLLAQDASNAAQAEQSYRTAIDIARQQKAKSWELRATTSLARLLAKQDKRKEARAMLAEIYSWFTEGFDTADLKDAKTLLDELSG